MDGPQQRFSSKFGTQTPKMYHDMGASIYDVSKIFGILDPLPPVRIWDWSTVLNSHNLPYYIFFWDNPSPPSVRTSYMDAPKLIFEVLGVYLLLLEFII